MTRGSRTQLAVLTGVAALMLPGCGARSDLRREASLETPVTLCDVYRDALCGYYSECHDMLFRDRERCRRELDCYGVSALGEAVAAGRVAYDPVKVDECFRRVARDPCRTVQLVGAFFEHRPGVLEFLNLACPGVVSPKQVAGAPCYTSEECVFGHSCTRDACPGTCVPIPGVHDSCTPAPSEPCFHPQGCVGGLCRLFAREGEPCTSRLDCVRDLECDSGSGLCFVPQRPGVGGFCITDFNGAKPAILCGEGSWCEASLVTREGICRSPAGKGEPCASDESCLPEHFCMSIGNDVPRCWPRGDVGAPCNQTNQCIPDLRCTPEMYPGTNLGTCGPRLGLGEPCQVVDDRSTCQRDLICDPPRCARPAFDGDPCDDPSTTCVRGECVHGRCGTRKRIGEACSLPDDCTTRSCPAGRCEDSAVCSQHGH